jgi:hypothetical protein
LTIKLIYEYQPHINMPGFTSFLLSNTPLYTTFSSSSSLSPASDPESSSDHESAPAKKHRLALDRQVSFSLSFLSMTWCTNCISVYATTLSRKHAEQVLETLKHLNSSINAQAETYEYALLSCTLKRRAFIAEFTSRAHDINRNGAAVLQQFQTEGVGGPVQALAEGFEELSRLTIAGKGEGERERGEGEGDGGRRGGEDCCCVSAAVQEAVRGDD